ncbi:MAG: hypothetical protein JO360_12635 [Acidobacteria bacterium]|nr:hypothetical protein [Acidobacteriota bacterium]
MLTALFFVGVAAAQSASIKAGDLKQLEGAQWKGTLTYLDYGRNKKISIPSNLSVTRDAAGAASWTFDYQYPDEPQANDKERITLGEGGKTLNDETVVERTTLPNKTLRIVTQRRGMDNDKPALLRYIYLLSPTSFNLRKEVRPDGATEFFERNEYAWTR